MRSYHTILLFSQLLPCIWPVGSVDLPRIRKMLNTSTCFNSLNLNKTRHFRDWIELVLFLLPAVHVRYASS